MSIINAEFIELQAPLTFVSDIASQLVWRKVIPEDKFQEYEKHKNAAYKVIEDYYSDSEDYLDRAAFVFWEDAKHVLDIMRPSQNGIRLALSRSGNPRRKLAQRVHI